MVGWEYKLHYQSLMTKMPITRKGSLENYEKNLQDGEEKINQIAKKGWELFSSHVTAFNMLVFIFKRKKKK